MVSFWKDQPPRPFVAPAFLLTSARPGPLLSAPARLSQDSFRKPGEDPFYVALCMGNPGSVHPRLFMSPGALCSFFLGRPPSPGSSYLRPPTPEALALPSIPSPPRHRRRSLALKLRLVLPCQSRFSQEKQLPTHSSQRSPQPCEFTDPFVHPFGEFSSIQYAIVSFWLHSVVPARVCLEDIARRAV